ncbi:MAG: hypothetical protein HYS34_06035 [Acidobacteria bacterium]|nr:hypothetical protein [Acidobacteriota bacterium]
MNLDIVPVKSERKQLVEEQILLRFSLFDMEKQGVMPDLGPLRFLLFESSGMRQRQGWAEMVDEGVYEVAIPEPKPGACYLFFACPKSGVWYAQLPHLILHTTMNGISVHRKAAESTATPHLC